MGGEIGAVASRSRRNAGSHDNACARADTKPGNDAYSPAMNIAHAHRLCALAALAVLPGCLATQTGSLEVLNPKQAYGRSVAVVGDLHRENEAIEGRLASDLQAALAKRGLTIAEDPAKADLIIVPTLGRMREKSTTPVDPVEAVASAPEGALAEVASPVIAAPAPEVRSFHRFASSNPLTRSDLISRGAVPSARLPAAAQQAGLLLTAYRAEDYTDYGIGRQSLPPVWRIYVSQPAMQMKWKSVAVPLINAAASAAAPLGKEQEHAARSSELGEKKEEPAEEQAEPRKERAKDQKPSEARRREAKPRANQDTNNLKDKEAAGEKKTET